MPGLREGQLEVIFHNPSANPLQPNIRFVPSSFFYRMASRVKASFKPSALDDIAGLVLLPLLYYFGVKFALSVTVMPQGTAVMWPPNSVILAAFLLLNRRCIVPVIILSLVSEIVGDMPDFKWYEGMGFGAINVAEAGIAALLLSSMGFDRQFSTLNDVLKFIIGALVIAASIGGFLGAGLYGYLRSVDLNFIDHARIIWFGDALGLLIFTPLWLSAWPNSGMSAPKAKLGIYDLCAGLAGLALIALFISSTDGMVFGVHIGPNLLLPFVIYVGLRFEVRWAAVMTALIGLIIIAMVVKDREPFGSLYYRQAVIQTQEFIFIMSLLGMGSAALQTQVRRHQAELETANVSLNELNRNLETRIEERTADLLDANGRLQQAYAELERLANVDGLTGIANRRTFDTRLQAEWARSAREGKPVSLILMDIDFFKKYNDGYGHQAGDACLKQVAGALAATVKRPADLVARYGGEEFAVVLPETDSAGAAAVAELICDAVRDLKIIHEFSAASGTVTVSAGIGTKHPGSGEESSVLISEADQALYRAKGRGRNCYVA